MGNFGHQARLTAGALRITVRQSITDPVGYNPLNLTEEPFTEMGMSEADELLDIDLRGLGPTVSAEELFEYVAGYEESIAKRFPLVTMCQYDVRQFSNLTIFNAPKLHRDTFRYPPDIWLA